MSPTWRARGSFWRRWQQTVVLCAVVVASNSLAAWAVVRHMPSSGNIATKLAALGPDGPRKPAVGGAEGPAGEGKAPGIRASDQGGVPGAPTMVDPAGAAGGESPVARLDRILSQRVTSLATEKGVPADKLVPAPAIREAALKSSDMSSTEAQALIGEYSRIFRELGQEMPVPPPPQR